MIPRSLSLAMLALAGIAATPQAWALGFGRVPDTMVFGQPLDLTVPVRLEAGESLAPACVQAEVHVGEQRLPPGALQVAVEQRGDEAVVRLRAAAAVHEPLVAVNLAVGCNGVVSRQFVVFADPPEVRAAVPPAVLPVTALVPMAAQAQPRNDAPAQAAPKPSSARKTARGKPAATGASMAGAEAPAAPTARRPAARTTAASRGKDLALPRAVAAAPAAPRLKLEEPEALLKAAMATVAAQDAAVSAAAQAASAAEAAASASEQRMLAMEGQLRQLRDEAGASKAALEQMRGRVAEAEDRARWQTLLIAAVLLLGGLVAWLAWRLRTLQRERQQAWWQAAAAVTAADAVAEATPGVTAVQPAAPVHRDASAPAVAPLLSDSALFDLDEVPPAPQHAGVLAPQPKAEDLLAPQLSVDELIDLEQQAEFFLVLGEEESAIDLLMSHLRSSGGTSPLPYLKLLEIYRRRDDREAYERLRKRFGQRFNAVAPDWDADPHRGRELLDYPTVLAALQAKWPQPLDAMAELENLLFRKRSGELFELPAYRDVLSLYSVARDLHRQVDDPASDVDVLLPLADEDSRRAGPPSIFDTAAIPPDEQSADERPTAPVDLDLSEPELLLDSRPAPLAPAGAALGAR